MELVYLWVEDYKNIKKQGFNFSPRFECEFKDKYENEKLEENCPLVVIDKEETKEQYLKNFFGENINITAIVGENGSGKSSIIEVLKDILTLTKDGNNFFYGKGFLSSRPSLIALFLINGKLEYLSTNKIKIKSILLNNKRNKLTGFPYHCYYANNQEPIGEYYEQSKLIEHLFSLDSHLIGGKLISMYTSEIDFELTSFMFLPNIITIKNILLDEEFSNITSGYLNGSGFPIDLDKDMTEKQEDKAIITSQNQAINKGNELSDIFMDTEDDYHKFLIIEYIHMYGDDDYLKFDNKTFLNHKMSKYLDFLTEEDFNKYFQKKEIFVKDFSQFEKDIYFKNHSRYFEFDFIDKKLRKISSLSHGEKTIFGLMLNMYYFLVKNQKENILFLLDEPDLSLHPSWQKNFIYEVTNLLKKINKKCNVILTTHSPFLLSDIPKENVVFLKKGKQVYPFENGQTFGANIHTLLSHGFFMENGLIGEFAKSKIDTAIKYLNQGNLTEEKTKYCENIISIIGEPIIKRQLQKMLDSKRLSEIDVIKKQIEQLQKELATKENKK